MLVVGMLLLVSGSGALARSTATITVTRFDDPVGGGCCSLRQAVAAAGAGDTVSLPAGTYTLTQGQISLSQDITIDGAGAASTTIQQTSGQRVFEIDGGTATVAALTITGGHETGSSPDAHAGVGGGFYVAGGAALHLEQSTLTGNTASVSGGGIDSNGTVVVDRSMISSNTVPGSNFGIGGAVDDFGTSLTITNSTLYANVVGRQGGAILAASATRLTNDTIVGNQAGTSGGGGGVYDAGGDVVVLNTLFDENTDTQGSDNCSAALDSHGYNIDSDGTCQFAATGDQNVDPGLDDESAAPNGGQTDTFALPASSPAVDAGFDGDQNNPVPSVDQRGVARPQGAHVDIGAYEFAPVSAGLSTVTAAPTSVTANGTSTATITVTLQDTAGNPVAGKTVALQASGSSVVSAASGPSGSNGVVTFTASDSVAESVVYTAADQTDALGITQTATVTFTAPAGTTTTTSAAPPPPPPRPVASFAFTPSAPVQGQSVSFDASATTGAATYTWDFGDGATATGVSAAHTYAQAGSYTVTLTATGQGGSATAVQAVPVSAATPPTPSFVASTRGADVRFNASGSERGSFPIVSYRWAFGDRATGTGAHTSHTYTSVRAYAVTLVVTDAAGHTAQITHKIAIAGTVTVSVDDGATESESPGVVPGLEVSIHDGAGVTDTVTVVRHPVPHHGK